MAQASDERPAESERDFVDWVAGRVRRTAKQGEIAARLLVFRGNIEAAFGFVEHRVL